jgi:hypothetical protein
MKFGEFPEWSVTLPAVAWHGRPPRSSRFPLDERVDPPVERKLTGGCLAWHAEA